MYNNRINLVDESQQEINKYRPLSKDILKQLKEYYKVGLTYTSNALEGNSLTETETKIVLEDGITIGGKPLRDHFEALGGGESYDSLYKMCKEKIITEKDIKDLHQLFYYRIDKKHAGKYRKKPAIITGSDVELPSPTEIPDLMKKFCTEIPELKKKYHPIEYAALLHIKFVNIHPFVDGNGRTARLLMNLALLQAGYEITIIPPVVRNDYIDALKASNKGNDTPFINLISNMAYESQQDYLRLIRALSKK
jgi:Fic family protein